MRIALKRKIGFPEPDAVKLVAAVSLFLPPLSLAGPLGRQAGLTRGVGCGERWIHNPRAPVKLTPSPHHTARRRRALSCEKRPPIEMVQMRILLRSILGALRRSNVATSPVSAHRLVSSSRPLLSFTESVGWYRMGWIVTRFGSVLIFLHGSPNMASISGVKGEELCCEDEECWAAEVPGYPMDDVDPMDILPNSSHRDGSIYSGTPSSRQEAMAFSDPQDCDNINGTCWLHSTRHMLQIFSFKLANIPVKRGPGSLINMSGPKRGIQLVDTTLIEYDMKIKTGGHESEDLQLIDGVSLVDDMDTWNCSPFTWRMHGGCGAIDITASRLNFAVEATVEVAISQVQSDFSMCLSCFTSGLHEEIRLFDGAIAESCGLKRSVIAVVMGAQMDLKFKVASVLCIPGEHCCSFKATKHGRATQEIKTDFALITVKVTWSTLD
ncbi:hypothetical protein SETIT_1G102900v2 [Setaria italica]|uniref:DUF6598 domain-containing protein n=1 Tax=Setaria italica TaxID=4555 RepID=A0A368PJM1_SETIT|nr:hypothetical protein SETIT_1G102900v2 [Setaria italica]